MKTIEAINTILTFYNSNLSQIKDLTSLNEAVKVAVDQLQGILNTPSADLINANQIISEKEQIIQERQQAIEEKDQTITDIGIRLAELDKENKELKAVLAPTETESLSPLAL